MERLPRRPPVLHLGARRALRRLEVREAAEHRNQRTLRNSDRGTGGTEPVDLNPFPDGCVC